MDANLIRKTAEEEIKKELFREAVHAMKEKMGEKKSFWHKIFPFKIRIERR